MSAEHLAPVNRRAFLGGASGAVATLLASQPRLAADAPAAGRPTRRPSAEELARTMPGPLPGRVIEVAHPESVVRSQIQAEPVRAMVRRGMRELFGTTDATEAWRRLFRRGDRVGIKVNPVGAPHAISNHATVHAVVAGLRSAGVRPADILVFSLGTQSNFASTSLVSSGVLIFDKKLFAPVHAAPGEVGLGKNFTIFFPTASKRLEGMTLFGKGSRMKPPAGLARVVNGS